MKAWREKEKLLHPQKVRNRDRKNSATWRDSNREEWRKYYAAYFRKWRNDPIRHACHKIRCAIGSLKCQLKNKPESELTPKVQKFLDALKSTSWCPHTTPSSMAINHRISLFHLFSFRIDLDRLVVCDPMNLELIPRVKNSRACKRRVNKDTIKLAARMEKKYPEQLKGFTKFLEEKLGEIY